MKASVADNSHLEGEISSFCLQVADEYLEEEQSLCKTMLYGENIDQLDEVEDVKQGRLKALEGPPNYYELKVSQAQ